MQGMSEPSRLRALYEGSRDTLWRWSIGPEAMIESVVDVLGCGFVQVIVRLKYTSLLSYGLDGASVELIHVPSGVRCSHLASAQRQVLNSAEADS
jgi:hypothetical protein